MDRTFGLDAIRALAISLVILAHTVPFAVISAPPFGEAINRALTVSAMMGVELFFGLSGFLIGGILFRDLLRGRFRHARDLGRFWMRRWLRTLPAYFLVLGCHFLLGPEASARSWEGVAPSCLRYATFTQNFFHRMPVFFEESWSLSVEEWSYLLLPLLLLAFARLCRTAASTILATLVLVICAPICWRYLFGGGVEALRTVVFFRLDALGFGLLAAWVRLERPPLWERLQRHGGWGVLPFLLLCGWLWRTSPDFDRVAAFRALSPAAAAACIALLVAASTRWQQAPAGPGAGFVVLLSTISYSLYLLHMPVHYFYHHLFYDLAGLPHTRAWQLLQYGSQLALILGVSAVFYRCWEKPMMDQRRKLAPYFEPTERNG